MAIGEIRGRLGVGETRARVIVKRPGFPEPVWELSTGRVWLADEVEAWIAANRPDVAEPAEGDAGQ